MSDPVTEGTPAPEDRPAASGPASDPTTGEAAGPPRPKRRRGSRGGRNRTRTPRPEGAATGAGASEVDEDLGTPDMDRQPDELPDRPIEGRPLDPAVAERALVKKPQIGDSRP